MLTHDELFFKTGFYSPLQPEYTIRVILMKIQRVIQFSISYWDKFYESNPGLSSRIANHMGIPDYTVDCAAV